MWRTVRSAFDLSAGIFGASIISARPSLNEVFERHIWERQKLKAGSLWTHLD